MIRRAVIVLLAAFVAMGLFGCGGSDGGHQTGTTDTRILGQWVASQITYDGQTSSCPGSINANDSTVGCTADTTTFNSNGQYVIGSDSEDFYFDGTHLILYNNAGNAVQVGVVFDETGNQMTWSFTQNNEIATITVNRVSS